MSHVCVKSWFDCLGARHYVRCVSATPEQARAEAEELSLKSGWRPKRWWHLRRHRDELQEFAS